MAAAIIYMDARMAIPHDLAKINISFHFYFLAVLISILIRSQFLYYFIFSTRTILNSANYVLTPKPNLRWFIEPVQLACREFSRDTWPTQA